jgi:hypothetical protein
MKFLPELAAFLHTNGTIYTIRQYASSSGDVNVDGVGVCKCTYLGPVTTMKTLHDHVTQSGFPTVEAWHKAARTFTYFGSKWYLYKVERRQLDEGQLV